MDEAKYSPGERSWREKWREKMRGGDFFVLSTARLDRLVKGSDVALDGFTTFAQQYPEARLIILNWGSDRSSLLERLAERGLADRVCVMAPAGKRLLIEYLRSADCLLDQFTIGYYGATALEAMACGTPVIMRIESAQYDALVPAGAPPVFQASTAAAVAEQLSRLASSPRLRISAGETARRWFMAAHGSSAWAPIYADLLAATAAGRRFDFRESSLNAPLGQSERTYHDAEKSRAPSFPDYQ
jgi:alpha-1,6-mannosyltransferase